MTNADYDLLVNKSFTDTMAQVKTKYTAAYDANPNLDNDVKSEYERLLPTIKPVIPALQLIGFLKEQGVSLSINYDSSTTD